MITTIIFIVIAYLCGSLSSAIIIAKLMGLPDPRTKGSGNPGTSNMLRLGGKTAALLTLLGDALKGFIPVLLAYLFKVEGLALGFVAFAAFLGHLYPIFFKFKGGKGVATFLGSMFALSIPIAIAVVITWLVVGFLFRYASLASIMATIIAPLYAIIFKEYGYIIPIIAMALLVIWRHRTNIERLRFGTESKIKLTKK
jgi:glycerol-3-phosphate acyltransferase PlsY